MKLEGICPFCGSSDLLLLGNMTTLAYACRKCNAKGPDTFEGSIEAINAFMTPGSVGIREGIINNPRATWPNECSRCDGNCFSDEGVMCLRFPKYEMPVGYSDEPTYDGYESKKIDESNHD